MPASGSLGCLQHAVLFHRAFPYFRCFQGPMHGLPWCLNSAFMCASWYDILMFPFHSPLCSSCLCPGWASKGRQPAGGHTPGGELRSEELRPADPLCALPWHRVLTPGTPADGPGRIESVVALGAALSACSAPGCAPRVHSAVALWITVPLYFGFFGGAK